MEKRNLRVGPDALRAPESLGRANQRQSSRFTETFVMKSKLKISIFGSSLVSAYWNGAATYYRGLVRALAARGHHITFFEPDAFERQQHRDMDVPEWAEVVVYGGNEPAEALRALDQARGSDVVIKASGVGVFDELLEEAVLDLQSPRTAVLFLDVDAPATLDRIESNPADSFRSLIARYDLILTYGGGDPVVNAYRKAGARGCVPIYNALDTHTHYPVAPDARFAADLAFLGNRMPDREARVEEFFLKAAAQRPERTFLLGGNGWQDKAMPQNIKWAGHVYTRDHNAFNCTPLAVLNINRGSMARYGFSPPTRVFEAAGAGACLITDEWEGIDMFLEPDTEVLVAADGDAVVAHLDRLSPARARAIGQAAYRRVIAEHTYAHRAELLERVLEAGSVPSPRAKQPMSTEVAAV
jgi:spore maturation protein CgeB